MTSHALDGEFVPVPDETAADAHERVALITKAALAPNSALLRVAVPGGDDSRLPITATQARLLDDADLVVGFYSLGVPVPSVDDFAPAADSSDADREAIGLPKRRKALAAAPGAIGAPLTYGNLVGLGAMASWRGRTTATILRTAFVTHFAVWSRGTRSIILAGVFQTPVKVLRDHHITLGISLDYAADRRELRALATRLLIGAGDDDH